MSLTEAVLHVDGASRGNPGRAGIGVVLADADGNVLHEVSESIGEATNNVAEYTAWIRGLALAADFGARHVTIHSDSELVVRQLKGEYRVKQDHLRDLCGQVTELCSRFDRVRVRHISREDNEQADRLASSAAAGDTEPEGRTVDDFA